MAAGKYRDTFRLPGFAAFFWTQFLGAFNDNFYKMAVSLVALNAVVSGAGSFYVDLIALLFILPSAFFWTQFLGAFNDNFYKMAVSLVALNAVVSGAGSFYVDLIALLFILPSALFSGYAGQLADVYSKRAVLVGFKVFEIFVMTLALIAFLAGGIDAMLVIVFLMGVHAAFFSPAKYGIL